MTTGTVGGVRKNSEAVQGSEARVCVWILKSPNVDRKPGSGKSEAAFSSQEGPKSLPSVTWQATLLDMTWTLLLCSLAS